MACKEEGGKGKPILSLPDDAKKLLSCMLSMTVKCCARCMLGMVKVRDPLIYALSQEEIASSIADSLDEEGRDRCMAETSALACRKGDCCVCMGLLQSDQGEISSQVKEALTTAGYDVDSPCTFMLSLSAPSSIFIRQYLYYYKALEGSGGALGVSCEQKWIELKEVYRLTYGRRIQQVLSWTIDQSSTDSCAGRVKVTMEYRHEESAGMKEVLLEGKSVKRTMRERRERGQRKGNLVEIENIIAVHNVLHGMTPAALLSKFSWPPAAISKEPELTVKVERESVYIGGCYCKYSRKVSQSPWNEAHGELQDSVQTLILKEIAPLYQPEETKFMGSGREDVDVRMLGEGRPFFIEFVNCKRLPIFPHSLDPSPQGRPVDFNFEKIQELVNLSTDLVQVSNLRPVGRDYVDSIKSSGETKRKTYRALVWTSAPLPPSKLDVLNQMQELAVFQNTPIRVLHRRSLAERKRTVYRMSAERVNDRFFLLDLETEAGTYIKEFVHGDLGRTRPSVGGLLCCEADILQLDVVGVEL
mmetsp:Transcript_21429/g.70985  ORF Transcript_21429/g.70985 Transcript_21429/m.70985 type:complete len:529 (-) Transcript_21429:46-1632(-)